MSAPRHRIVRSLATTTVAASLLVGAVATSAQAATYPTLTKAQAKKLLPASKLLPGKVKLTEPLLTSTKNTVTICLTKPKHVPLAAGTTVSGTYATKQTDPFVAGFLSWEVTVTVFPTPGKATAALAGLNKAEKTCPKSTTQQVKGVTETLSRVLGTKYAVGAFKGYRAVEHIALTDGTNSADVRDFTTFLVRGNSLLTIEETANASPANGKLQDTWRKTVTALMTKRIAAVK
jgi:hypothetical protein